MEFDKIIQPEEFWWKAVDNTDLFSYKETLFFYDPYSVRFLKSIYNDTLSVRRFIYFDILIGNYQLLDSGLIIDYHVNIKSYEDAVDEITKTAEEANNRFIELIRDHRHQSYIFETFEPKFDREVASRRTKEALWSQGVK